ncbi:MAG: four helix bundle protein [Desulfurobacterium sp.]|nr:MAG: four helix bundle protein [Desulfurobacterium sp.]
MGKSVRKTEDLEVFKRAHKLTVELYELTNNFPQSEKFTLVSQIRRAAISICANLMEGSHRHSSKEFRQFVGIANGSAGELKYYLLLAKDLGYLENEKYKELIKEVNQISKMLRSLSSSLLKKSTISNTNTSTNTHKTTEVK